MSLGQIQARNLLVSSQVLQHGLLRGSSAFVSPSLVKDRVCSVLNRAICGVLGECEWIILVPPMDGGCSSWTNVCPLAGHKVAASNEAPFSRSHTWLGHQCGPTNTQNCTGQVTLVSLMWGWKCLWANPVYCIEVNEGTFRGRALSPDGGWEDEGRWGSTARALFAAVTILKPLWSPCRLPFGCLWKALWSDLTQKFQFQKLLHLWFYTSAWIEVA